jgi:hypothetical protein
LRMHTEAGGLRRQQYQDKDRSCSDHWGFASPARRSRRLPARRRSTPFRIRRFHRASILGARPHGTNRGCNDDARAAVARVERSATREPRFRLCG